VKLTSQSTGPVVPKTLGVCFVGNSGDDRFFLTGILILNVHIILRSIFILCIFQHLAKGPRVQSKCLQLMEKDNCFRRDAHGSVICPQEEP